MTDTLAQADHPFYADVDRLQVTRDQEIVATLPCQRTLLPRAARWPTHHIGGHLVRVADGSLHAFFSGFPAAQRWHSTDDGVTWRERLPPPEVPGALALTAAGGLVMATGGGEGPIRILRAADGDAPWDEIGRLEAGVFDAIHIDSNLLPLASGTLLLACNLRLSPPPGRPFGEGHYPQYVFRSADGGRTWRGGGDPAYWRVVRAGSVRPEVAGPETTTPGDGGTFDGVYETGFCEVGPGRLLGAFRMSGPPRPWHAAALPAWGEPPAAPDGHGRLFRHVVLGESSDSGITWRNLRPVLDARGWPLMAHGESNGELVLLPDSRLVLVHQTRYAEAPERTRGLFRGRSQLCARLSDDGGRTWHPERYRLLFGFGYPSSLALPDGTIVTAAGASLGDNGDPRRAAIVRWRPKEVK